MTRAARAALALLLLAASGCRGTLTLPGPGGVDGPPALASVLARHAAAVRSLRGDATVHARVGAEGGTARQVVVAEAPDRLRLETLGAFGQPALVFAAGPGSTVLFVAEEGTFYVGPGVARRVAFLPRGIEVEDVVALLLGHAPRGALAGAAAGRLTVLGRERRYRLEAVEPATGAGWRVIVDADRRYPVEVTRVGEDGAPLVRATFEDFRETPAGPFPFRLRVEEPGRALEARIEYGEIEFNRDVPSRAFELPVPRGAVTVEVQ